MDFVIGLGEKRKRALLKKFSGLDEIRASSVDEIAATPGFNRVLAERVLLQLAESGEEIQTFPPEDEAPVGEP